MSKLTSLQILIDELDNELISSSTTIESFQAFHSLAWFRKPGCTYVTDAAGLTLYNESDAIPYIVNALAQKMSVFQSPEPVLPNFVKSLLALSDLIQLLPIKQPYEELNPKILTIAQIPTESFQPHYQKLEQSLANLIELFVKLGLNPLKLLLDPSSPKSDPMFILHQVILCTASKESFDTAMKVIQTIIPSITSDKRIPFFETFYDFLYKFYTRFPSIHSDLINNGLESVQPVVDNLWKIKKDLEPQLVSILCSLIPMCHTQLTAAANSKKSPFKSVLKTVLKTVEEYKSKKAVNRLYYSYGMLELIEAIFIGQKSAQVFSKIIEFLTKESPKFTDFLFNKKNDVLLSGPMLDKFFPRYAALDYAKAGTQCQSSTILVGNLNTCQSWSTYVRFLELVFNDYPVQGNQKYITTRHFEQMTIHLNDVLNFLRIGSIEQSSKEQESNLVVNIVSLIGQTTKEFTLYSILLHQSIPTSIIQHPIPFQKFLASNPAISVQTGIIKNILSYISRAETFDIEPFLLFLQGTWTYNEDYITKISNQEIMKNVSEIITSFKTELELAINLNAPNSDTFYTLFNMFLNWTYVCLSVTLNKDKAEINNDMIDQLMTISLLLRSIIGLNKLDSIDNLIDQICSLYNYQNKYHFPMYDIPQNDEKLKTIIKYVMGAWLNYLTKKLQSENVQVTNIIQISRLQLLFTPDLKRISTMTEFLCHFCSRLEDVSNDEITSLSSYFFSTLFLFIYYLNEEAPSLSNAFQFLDINAFPTFFEISKTQWFSRAINFQYDRYYYWKISIDMLTSFCTQKLNDETITLIESTIPIFFNIIQFNVFENQTQIFIESMMKFIGNFYSNNSTNTNQTNKISTIITTFELALRYAIKTKDTYNYRTALIISKTIPILLDNLSFDINESNPNITEVSSENRSIKTISFLVNSLEYLLESNQTKEIIIYVQTSLNNILKNNSNLAWPIYIQLAKSSKHLFQSLLLESLTLLSGMTISSSNELFEVKRTNSEQVSLNKRKTSNSESSTHENYEILNRLLFSARSSRVTPEPFQLRQKDQLYDYLTKNNFEIFKNPPSLNIKFIQSAISCLIVYNKHDELIEEISKCYKPGIFDNVNPISIFFKAWFKQMISKYKLDELLKYAKVNTIIPFIDTFNPPSQFAYYLSKFAKLQSTEVAKDMFLKCFLKPLIDNPILYNVHTYLNELNKTEFINTIIKCNEYQELLESMINSEPIYPVIKIDTFVVDRQIVVSYIGERPMTTDRLLGTYSNKSLKPDQAIIMNTFNWLMDAGEFNDGSKAFYILPPNIPDLPIDILIIQFNLHLQNIKNNYIFIIDIKNITEMFINHFMYMIKNTPKDLCDKIKKIYLINPSYDSAKLLNDNLTNVIKQNTKLNEKIIITDDITNYLTSKDKVYLPEQAFGIKYERRGYISVTYNSISASFIICNLSVTLLSNINILGNKTNVILQIPIYTIQSVEYKNDVIIKYSTKLGVQSITLKTNKGKYIMDSFQLLKERVNTVAQLNVSNLLSTMTPLFKIQMISFSLYLIALRPSYLINQVLQLFESSIRKDSINIINCPIISMTSNKINMGILFEEVINSGYLEEVVNSLINYIDINEKNSLDALIVLLPLFVKFINISKSIPSLSKIISGIYHTIIDPQMLYSLQRYFFNEINNQTAIEVSIYIILQSNIDINIAKRCLQSFMWNQSKLMGEIIIKKLFDGIIRRRTFGHLISPIKFFSAIHTLPFNSKEFSTIDLPLFFFGLVMGLAYSTDELIQMLNPCFEGMFENIIQINPNLQIQLNNFQQKINLIMLHPKTLKPIKFISLVDSILEIIDKDYQERYRKYFIDTKLDDNPEIWFIKKSGSLLYKEGTMNDVLKYMIQMPILFNSNDYGPQKLSICYESLTKIITKFNNNLMIPICLLFPTMYCTHHSNTMLRNSSIKLINVILDYIFIDNNNNINIKLLKECDNYLCKIGNSCLKEFQTFFMIDFFDNFLKSFSTVLTCSFIEIDTRKITIDLYKNYSLKLKNTNSLIYFIIPLVVFGNNDILSWISNNICNFSNNNKTDKEIVAEIIFKDFDKRNESECLWVINYLISFLGGSTCQNRFDDILDLLLYAANNYLKNFEKLIEAIYQKCLNLINNIGSNYRTEKLSTLCAALCNAKLDTIRNDEINEYKKCDENLLKQCVYTALSTLADAVYFNGFGK